MNIKVCEMVERDCCDRKRGDLVKVKDRSADRNTLYWFCQHCGRHWRESYDPKLALGKAFWTPVPFPWEPTIAEQVEKGLS